MIEKEIDFIQRINDYVCSQRTDLMPICMIRLRRALGQRLAELKK